MANKALMKRAGTMQIHSSSGELPIKVAEFTCEDKTTMGKHNKTWTWTFQLGDSQTIWYVNVQEAMVGSNTVEFTTTRDGVKKEVYKGKFDKDIHHKLPVKGTLNIQKQYEVKNVSGEAWYPATLTNIRDDGKYEAEVLMPPDDYGNQKKVHYPIVEPSRIRDPFSKKVVDIPETMVELNIRKDNTLMPELTINNNAFTSYFCVPSPSPMKPPDYKVPSENAEINFTVSKDRKTIQADVGHGKLKEAIDATKPGAKVRAKDREVSKDRLRKKWSIMIGAYGEHHIVAETKSKSSKEITITIDGKVVVGGAAADLGGSEFSVDIAVQGKVELKYKLYETSGNGVPTDRQKTVTKKLLRSNTLRISVPDHANLEQALLECDEVEFGTLEQYKPTVKEENIGQGNSCSLETFESTHGIQVPYAMDKDNSGGGFADDFAEFMPGGASGIFAMLNCCNKPPVDDESQVVIGPGGSASSGSNFK
jgi:hypothetical protein